jgi:hypothetical protein
MKKNLIVFLLFLAVQAFAADKSLVTVKDSTVSDGVILVTIQQAGKTYDLQCTQSAPFCTAPKVGDYWMVRLPKNHGVYDCSNVDLYPQSSNPEAGDQILGEYCLNAK